MSLKSLTIETEEKKSLKLQILFALHKGVVLDSAVLFTWIKKLTIRHVTIKKRAKHNKTN